MTSAGRALPVALCSLLVACASVQTGAPERDFAAKQFTKPLRGKAALYVFRTDSAIGGGRMTTLQLDGQPLGETGPKTFQWVTIKPGKHTLVGRAENESTVEFTATPGQNVFVWQEVKGLLSPENHLEVVDEERGRAGVEQCELAEATTD